MLSNLGSKMVETLLDQLRTEKISLSFLALSLGGLLWVYNFALDTFVTKAEAQQEAARITTVVDMIQSHREEYRIDRATDLVADIKLEIRHLSQHMEERGEDPKHSREMAELQEELSHAEEYKRCLINRRPNCAYLKDVE